MSRIPYPAYDQLSERVQKALVGKRQINVFKMVSTADNCAPEVLALGHKLSRGSSLPVLDREIAILRTARVNGVAYQWHEHLAVADRVGLPAATVAAIEHYPSGAEVLSEHERALIDFVDAVIATTTAPDPLFDAMRAAYSDSQVVELVLMIGFYGMVGRVMNTFELKLQDGDPGTFPEVGPEIASEIASE